MATANVGHAESSPTGVATWNMGWLLDQATHTRWVKACSDTGWRSADDLIAAGKAVPATLDGLPYCDVHNGLDYRKADACKRTLGEQYYQRPNQLDSTCRVSPDLADWDLYKRKLQSLREAFLTLANKGVGLVAVQEVSNDAALEQIAPLGWKVETTQNLKGVANIAQHVGVAWDPKVVSLRDFKAINELSLKEARALRPGLSFVADIEGLPTEFLVVHLKAGCRSVPLNAARGKAQAECAMLAKQVPLIEEWIDARIGKSFVIVGDFNRSLLKELQQNPEADPIRFGVRENPVLSFLVPEWNDDNPRGSTIHIVDHLRKPDGTLIAGDWYCAQTVGIDHVILSERLAKRIRERDPVGAVMKPISYMLYGKKLTVKDKAVIPPSDHCARYVNL